MIVISCQHENKKKHGHDRKGNQRFRCLDCGKTWVDETARPLGNMRISMDKATQALGMILEGMSIRATMRLTGLDRNTLCDLILIVGENCQRLLDAKVKNVAATDIQLDEIWSFIAMKEKTRVARHYGPELGDSWTFIGIERETKLILAHQVGNRDSDTCWAFLMKLKNAGRVERWRGGLGIAYLFFSRPFVCGCLTSCAMLRFHTPAHRTVRADFSHTALRLASLTSTRCVVSFQS